MEGRVSSLERTMEELKEETTEVHEELKELTRIVERRTRNQDRGLKGAKGWKMEINWGGRRIKRKNWRMKGEKYKKVG